MIRITHKETDIEHDFDVDDNTAIQQFVSAIAAYSAICDGGISLSNYDNPNINKYTRPSSQKKQALKWIANPQTTPNEIISGLLLEDIEDYIAIYGYIEEEEIHPADADQLVEWGEQESFDAIRYGATKGLCDLNDTLSRYDSKYDAEEYLADAYIEYQVDGTVAHLIDREALGEELIEGLTYFEYDGDFYIVE